MPEIPLFNGGETVKTGAIPQMPLDNQRRPRADFRGIISGLGQVAQAQGLMAKAAEQPTLNVNMFSGLDEGYQALAKGIKDVGGFLQHYAEKRQEVINDRDVGRARNTMQEAYVKHLVERDRSRPESWGADFKTRVDGLKSTFAANKGLSQYARDQIANELESFQSSYQGRILIDSTENIHKEAGDQIVAGIERSKEAGEEQGVTSGYELLVSKGHMNKGVAEQRKLSDLLYIKQRRRESAANAVHAAALAGDDAGRQEGLKRAELEGLSKEDLAVLGERSRQTMVDVLDRRRNEIERDVLGDFAYRLSAGKTVLPSEVTSLVSEKKIRPGVAAPLLDSVNNRNHPASDVWGKFVDKTALYDVDDDPKSSKIADLYAEALALNPSQGQLVQFNQVLERARHDNADRKKRVETRSRVGGRNAIRTALEGGSRRLVMDDDFRAALLNTQKLEAFGISKPSVERIQGYMQGRVEKGSRVGPEPAAALREFKAAAVARKARASSPLTDAEYRTYQEAADSDEAGFYTNAVRARSLMSHLDGAMENYEQWFDEQVANSGVPPDDAAVSDKVKKLVDPVLHGHSLTSFSPQEGPVRQRVTSYAFPGDTHADSMSAAGIGAFVPDGEAAKIRRGEPSEYRLKAGDVAVSPDVEALLRKEGVKPHDRIRLTLSDGTTLEGRWMDRTMTDKQAREKGWDPLRGRWDIYSPDGLHAKNDVSVTGFSKVKP